MNRLLYTLLTLSLVLTFQNSSATIRRVPEQYGTILLAYNATANGDTIVIGQGAYGDAITIARRITLIGAGYELTKITNNVIFNTGSNRSVMEGIAVQYEAGNEYLVATQGTVDSVAFRRCLFYDTGASSNSRCYGRTSGAGGRVYFDDCAFLITPDNLYDALGVYAPGDVVVLRSCLFANTLNTSTSANHYALSGSWASLTAHNCAFLGFRTLTAGNGSSTALVNCVVYDTVSTAAFNWNLPPGTVMDYCASENAPPAGATNHVTLSANPFESYNRTTNYVLGVSDVHPAAGSVLIDAGHPSMLDLNGTRSDVGMYGGLVPFVDGGVPAYPFVTSLSVPPAVAVGESLDVQATGRIGRSW